LWVVGCCGLWVVVGLVVVESAAYGGK